jgi:hypothetical protein
VCSSDLSVVLRAIAAFLGFAFVLKVMSDLRKSEKDICGASAAGMEWSLGGVFVGKKPKAAPPHAGSAYDRLVQQRSNLSWTKRCNLFFRSIPIANWRGESPTGATGVLRSYLRFGRLSARLARTALLILLYLLFSLALILGTQGLPNRPVRGPWAWWVDFLVLIASIIGLFVITFFVIDALRLCQRFVRLLGRRPAAWRWEWLSADDRETWDKIRVRYKNASDDGLDERQTIRAIAKHTRAVNKLMWYPFIVLLLMVLARQRMFDGWDYPWPLMVVQLLLLVALWLHNWRLRIEADDARQAILMRLHNLVLACPEDIGKTRREQLKDIIDDVEKQQTGAFGHWTEDYFLKAMTLPFLGEGGMFLLDRFMSPV